MSDVLLFLREKVRDNLPKFWLILLEYGCQILPITPTNVENYVENDVEIVVVLPVMLFMMIKKFVDLRFYEILKI